MKFIKLYSNSEIFKPISFNSDTNINFILSDGHSVGKTKLLELIDYCLLKDKPEFLKLDRFKEIANLTFYLEIKIESIYVTIKRVVNARRDGNCIIKSSHSLDCRSVAKFDFQGSKEDALDFLNGILNFQLFDKQVQFRLYLNYFLRTQDDQSDVFKLNKFKGRDIDYKPIISNLLGVSGTRVRNKYELENEIDKLKKEIKVLEFDIGIDTTEAYIREEINVLEKMKLEKGNRFKEFDFYTEENKISKELVNSIESEISVLNKKRNSLNREIEYINTATNDNLLINMNELKEFFEELNTTFPNDLQIEYGKVIEFNQNLTTERISILQENRINFITELEIIDKELFDLNNRRKDMLSLLTDSDTMSKFKKLEKDIIDLEINIDKEHCKLKKFDLLKEKNDTLETQAKAIKTTVAQIKESITQSNKLSTIKKNISEFARLMFNEEALFSVGLNAYNNIEFNLKLSNNNNFDNKRDDGNTFRKLLSFLFSISIVISYKEQNFFKFAVLDSPFDGDQVDYQDGLYKVIKKVANEHNIQIILTSVEDEIKNLELKEEAKKYAIRHLTENDTLIGEF